MKIERKALRGGSYINISGGSLKYKFRVHELKGIYTATASNTNPELIRFLDSLPSLAQKKTWNKDYLGWNVDTEEVITVMNAVIREFE